MEKRVYENRNGRRRERTEKSGEGIENRRAIESEKAENRRGYRRKKMCMRGLDKLVESTEREILILSDEMRERLIEQTRERKREIKNVKDREGVGMRRKRGVRLIGERYDDRKGEQERTSLRERKTRTKRGKSD